MQACRTGGADGDYGRTQASALSKETVDLVIAVECVRLSGLSEEQQSLVFAENFKRLWE
ncbi:MAG: hypothetical protein JSV79_00615 [Armatimonadota bacterium]|nr:MAG: hypothetical protein JSV79_00615 [Armatimonadota bacterium]